MADEGRTTEDIDLVLDDLMSLSFSCLKPPDRAIAEYTLRLTRVPWEITREDTERLRDEGFDDRAIHDICTTAAYFAFVNRVSDGLGVDLEERFERGREGL
jgi:alkylhydroperoxidase family enzyme